MLRDYQYTLTNSIYTEWQHGSRAVVATMATGGGKTVVYSKIMQDYNAPAVLVAHRSELVSQSALALNREHVPHSIIAPKATIAEIVKLEHETHGHSSFAWRAPIRVAGVDTLVRENPSEKWLQQIALVVVDEGHHVLRANKWGETLALMPNARVLGVTAHCVRADNKGLGRAADGVYDSLVQGPHARELIGRGYLTDYRMMIPPTDIDFSEVTIGSTGDYSAPQLRAATHKSKRLVGDIVNHYVREAGGKLGLTFAVDIEAANELCVAYRKAGVAAEIITGQTNIAARAQIMRAFRERRILQLISVDVLGEGTDVPAVEVVSLGRRTASWQLMCQQIGRALRTSVDEAYAAGWGNYTDAERCAIIAASAKPKALILDHVGNLLHHYEHRGFPDARQEYSLDRRPSRGARDSDAIPLRACLQCFQPYERFRVKCPYCGAPIPPPAGRAGPEQVDGDLTELDPEILAQLRGEVKRIDAPVRVPANVTPPVAKTIINRHHERFTAQQALRARMALWAGYWHHIGFEDREIQRLFFYTFRVDVLTAQSMGAQDALNLQMRVDAEIGKLNIVELQQGETS